MTPQFLEELVERFDPDGFDAPGGSARVRVRWNGDACDVSIRDGSVPSGRHETAARTP